MVGSDAEDELAETAWSRAQKKWKVYLLQLALESNPIFNLRLVPHGNMSTATVPIQSEKEARKKVWKRVNHRATSPR